MTNINTRLTRGMLASIHAEVRKAFPHISVRRAASVTHDRVTALWFVQIHVDLFAPFDDYYKAYDAYEARGKAWQAFMRKHSSDQLKAEAA